MWLRAGITDRTEEPDLTPQEGQPEPRVSAYVSPNGTFYIMPGHHLHQAWGMKNPDLYEADPGNWVGQQGTEINNRLGFHFSTPLTAAQLSVMARSILMTDPDTEIVLETPEYGSTVFQMQEFRQSGMRLPEYLEEHLGNVRTGE